MDSLVMTITIIGAAAMTLAAAIAVAKGQFEQPVPIRVEEDSQQ